MSLIWWTVSQSDVEAHPKYSEGATLDSILNSYGMDTSKGYFDDERWKNVVKDPTLDEEECEDSNDYFHRSPFTGEVCKGPRWTGLARQDGKWKRFVRNFLELHTE